MKQLVLGTAGHIDHGKTSLVRALTGIETDRLKEEKARGITIELGFAHLDLSGGLKLGIVDVPGHEKFVKNMVAGAAGIDMVMLVIAADEGVMPQTREHLDICRLLGVAHGLVALTKIDMVDEEWLELVTEDVAEYLEGSFLEGAPIMPVSSTTGQGIDELKAELDRLAAVLEERPSFGPFRLPVDRVFTMRGFGTVVTGTAIGGEVSLGQELMLYPTGTTAKVRGLQVHSDEVETARRGSRTAVNLQGLEKVEVERGFVLATPGSLVPSLWVDVDLTALPGLRRPIKHRAPVRFHAGTAEIMGRVHTLDRDEILPGDRCLCQVRLESPVSLLAGDHFVLRSYSPVHTIAGGRIVHPSPARRKRHRDEVTAALTTLRDGTPEERIRVLAEQAGEAGLSSADLTRLVDAPPKEVEAALQGLLSRREVVRFDKEAGRLLAASVQEELLSRALDLVRAYHKAQPLKPGMPREELRQRLTRLPDVKLFTFLVNQLTSEEKLKADKELLRLPDHQVRLAADDEALRKKIEEAYRAGGVTPPNLKDVINEKDQAAAKGILGVLVNEGKLVKVKGDLYYEAQALAGLKEQVRAYLEEHGRIDAARFKEMTGLSRKYAIPLLEHFDATNLTMRVGDERILRKR